MITVVFFVGCQEDDDNSVIGLDNEVNSEQLFLLPNIDILSKEEFSKHHIIYNRLQNHLNSTTTSLTRDVETGGLLLEEEGVKYITYGDYHSYTFSIIQDDINLGVRNLVLSLMPNGDYGAVLLTYDLTEEEIINFHHNAPIELINRITEEEVEISQEEITILTSRKSGSTNRAQCEIVQYTSTDMNGFNYTSLAECESNHGSGGCFYNPIIVSNCPGNPVTTIGADGGDSSNDGNTGSGDSGGSEDTDNDANDNGIPDHLEQPDGQTENTGGGGQDSTNTTGDTNTDEDEEEENTVGIFVSSIIIPLDISNIITLNALLEENLNSEQRTFVLNNPEFAEAAIKALENGGEVDFDDKVIYDLADKPCQKNVMENVLSLSSDFTDLINNTFDSTTQTNLRLSAGNIPGGNAFTIPYVSGDQSAYYVDIRFDDTYLDNATDLSIAAIMLHELVHAYFVNLFVTNQMSAESDSLNDLLNAFIAFYDERVEDTASTVDNEIHNAMNDFIENAALSLFNFAESQGIPADLEYCNHLMWGTMFDSELFEEALTEDQQISYGNIAGIEQENTMFEGQNPKGSPCE